MWGGVGGVEMVGGGEGGATALARLPLVIRYLYYCCTIGEQQAERRYLFHLAAHPSIARVVHHHAGTVNHGHAGE